MLPQYYNIYLIISNDRAAREALIPREAFCLMIMCPFFPGWVHTLMLLRIDNWWCRFSLPHFPNSTLKAVFLSNCQDVHLPAFSLRFPNFFRSTAATKQAVACAQGRLISACIQMTSEDICFQWRNPNQSASECANGLKLVFLTLSSSAF